MRKLHSADRIKRGCQYCTDMIPWNKTRSKICQCLHEKCPYDELNETESYGEYLEKHGDMMVDQILKAMEKM